MKKEIKKLEDKYYSYEPTKAEPTAKLCLPPEITDKINEIIDSQNRMKCTKHSQIKKGEELVDKEGFIYGVKFFLICSKCRKRITKTGKIITNYK